MVCPHVIYNIHRYMWASPHLVKVGFGPRSLAMNSKIFTNQPSSKQALSPLIVLLAENHLA